MNDIVPTTAAVTSGPLRPTPAPVGTRDLAVYRKVVCTAVRLWETTVQPDTIVVPWWMPVDRLVTLFDQHGVPVETVAAVLSQLEKDGDLILRTMTFRGHGDRPVAGLTAQGRMYADRHAARTDPANTPLGLPEPLKSLFAQKDPG